MGTSPLRAESSFSSPAIDQLSMEPHRTRQLYSQLRSRALQRSTITMQELDGLMAKLEQDNRILAELDKKRACLGSSCTGYHTRMCSTTSLSTTLTGSHHGALAPVAASRSSLGVSAGGRGSLGGLTLPTLPAVSEPPNGVLGAVSPGLARMHHVATPTVRQDSHGMLMAPMSAPGSQQHQLQQQQQQHQPGSEEDSLGVESVEFVDLPGRGRCRVYVARYSYDPLKQSPNEHPEAELYLNAGDYILIFGDMDEDGFFNGELMDGRKGLVPSNFVLKLTGEDLFEFQTTILYGNRDSDDSSASFSYAPDLDALVGADEQHRLPPEDLHRMNDYIDLEDIEEVDEDALSETERENDGMATWVPQDLEILVATSLDSIFFCGLARTMGEARERVYQRLESSLRRLHALNEDSTTYLKVLQRLGDELDRVPNDNDATGLMLSLKATAAGRRRRKCQIRVQPTSLTRRRPGLTRGMKRMPAACPLSDQPAKRPRKRPHSLQRNVQDNVPSAGLLKDLDS
ncbi:hypothetical protein ISCGN_007709 [Ixodes scapularis]